MADDLFKDLSLNQEVFLTRYKRGKFRDGLFSAAVLFRRRFKDCSIQPLTQADEVRLPDGLNRITSGVKIYSSEKLTTSNPDKGTKADELEIDGVKYQIDSVDSWTVDELSHYESIAFKVTT